MMDEKRREDLTFEYNLFEQKTCTILSENVTFEQPKTRRISL